MALPLHSILLPRRFIHVDDNRENLLAGCGPYIDRFELSPFPVLRTRLGIFLRSGEDVEGLVRVKGTLHFIAFSRRRVALLSEDNLMEGGIVSNLLISDPLDDILQVICAQIIENDLTLILVTSSAFHVRKIVVDPSGLRCSFLDAFDDLTTGYPLVSASFNGLATAFATLRQDGSVIFTLMFFHSKCGATFDFSTETTMRTLPIPSCPDDKFDGIKSLFIGARPSLYGLVRATVYVWKAKSIGVVEMSAMQKIHPFSDVVTELPDHEKVSRIVRQGLAAVGFEYWGVVPNPSESIPTLDCRTILDNALVHPSATDLAGIKTTVVHNRFVYTSASFRPREGSLIGTDEGEIFLWGIVEEASTPEKRRMTVSLARRGDETRLPSETGVVEEKNAKWGVVTHWTPSKMIGKVVALSSTLSPSSAANTIAAIFSSGKAAVFLLALDKIVFVQFLETEIKDPVGISVSLEVPPSLSLSSPLPSLPSPGTDNLNSRCSSPFPSSAVVSGGNSIEVVRICRRKFKKAIEKVWENA